MSGLITGGNSLGYGGVGIEVGVLGLVRWCLEWLGLSVLKLLEKLGLSREYCLTLGGKVDGGFKAFRWRCCPV